MAVFRLVAFAVDEHMTLELDDRRGLRLFGDFAVTSAVTEEKPATTRLLAKLVVGGDEGMLGRLRRPLMAWGASS